MKDYTQAMSDYSKAILCNPKFAKVYNNRGLFYYDIENDA
jgi:hypothetical protein